MLAAAAAVGGAWALTLILGSTASAGGFGGSMNCDPSGADEALGVLFEVDDKALSNAFAMAGLGSIYRQSKHYGVEAVPERYAALARAAYEGFNATLVDEIVKARSGK
jgi:hypothetical protein